MTLCRNPGGYSVVSPFVGGKTIYRQVHRLVAQAFIPNPGSLPVVNHIDGNRENNAIENLEWVTYQENANKIVFPNAANRRRSKRVVEVGENQTILREWASAKAAAEEIGISPSALHFQLRKQTTNRFKYLDLTETPTDEEWRSTQDPGSAELIEISSCGRIRLADGQIVIGRDRNGYLYYRKTGVHILVATAFLENPEEKKIVNHLDGSPLNNNLTNLEWVTQQENCVHAHSSGLCRRRPVRLTETDGTCTDYDSIKAACEVIHIYPSDIVKACKTGRPTAGGRSWEYIRTETPLDPSNLPLLAPENEIPDEELDELLSGLLLE